MVSLGASDKDIADAFFNSEITVMIGGILAGGFISFGVFLVVGFVCVKIKNRRPQQNQTQNQHNLNHQQNNHCNLNGSTNGNGVVPGNGNKALLQVSFYFSAPFAKLFMLLTKFAPLKTKFNPLKM